MEQLKMSQDEDSEMSFSEFCDEFCPEAETESRPFMVLSANDVVKLMKTETEKVCEIVNVSVQSESTAALSYRVCYCFEAASSAAANAFDVTQMGHRLVFGKVL